MSQPVAHIEIAGQQVTRIEYRGQQVVTFAMIDKLHRRPDGTAKRSHDENRARFESGTDFVLVSLAAMRKAFPEAFPARGGGDVTLLTQRGYFKVTRSFKDDQSWAIFDEMLDRYFMVEDAFKEFGLNDQGELMLDTDGIRSVRSEINRNASGIVRTVDGIKGAVLNYLSKHVMMGLSQVTDSISDLYQRTGKGLITINNNVKAINARLEDLDARLLPPSGDRPIILSEWYGCARIYRELCGVEHFPRQGMLSASVSRSLDSFVLRRRQNHHMTIIDLATKPTKAWHEASVRPWFDEMGRRMIESHINRFSAPLLERNVS